MKPNEEIPMFTRIESQTARIAFKNWPIRVQRIFLEGLLSEHAYACGVAGELLEVRGVKRLVYSADFNEGISHRLRDKKGAAP